MHNVSMAQGPSLIFDKSALESLNLDEAVMMDNFYMSTITPLFYVECLADLEKEIRSKSTPEQLVGSLANRTPDSQGMPNAHHLNILKSELSRDFDLTRVMGRVALAGGKYVQLGGETGAIYQPTQESEAFMRWSRREFLEIERTIAKKWRSSLTAIDLDAMVKHVSSEIGPWRKPKSLEDAKQIADTVIDYLDPEFLLTFGLRLLGVPESADWVINHWKASRHPSLRGYVPYFVFLLTINIFFCLVLPTQLLRNVKQSHQVDLAYLYYLPFCSVFTSKDNFHKSIVPLFLGPTQDFIEGVEFKADMSRLVEYYSNLPSDLLKQGLYKFAAYPPEDDSFFTTRMWDKYLPRWREIKDRPQQPRDPNEEKRTMSHLKEMTNAPEVRPNPGMKPDEMTFVSVQHSIRLRKGRFQRFSDEQIERMRKNGEFK